MNAKIAFVNDGTKKWVTQIECVSVDWEKQKKYIEKSNIKNARTTGDECECAALALRIRRVSKIAGVCVQCECCVCVRETFYAMPQIIIEGSPSIMTTIWVYTGAPGLPSTI